MRIAIWRGIKRLGALSLQRTVWLLPSVEVNRLAFSRLAQCIEESGGKAMILEVTSPNSAWQADCVARFNAARDEEYQDVVDGVLRLHAAIARNRRQGASTSVVLEKANRSFERVSKCLADVRARDTFGTACSGHTVAEVEKCARVLDAFARELYVRQETPDEYAL